MDAAILTFRLKWAGLQGSPALSVPQLFLRNCGTGLGLPVNEAHFADSSFLIFCSNLVPLSKWTYAHQQISHIHFAGLLLLVLFSN